MNKYHLVSLLLFIIGLIFFLLSFISGEGKAGIFIIFPFIYGTGVTAMIGGILIMLSLIIFMLSFMSTLKTESLEETFSESVGERGTPAKTRKIKHGQTINKASSGGIVLIGPIPIIFGSNWKIALVLSLIALVIITVSLLYLIL
jgi:uncharacterized protein (TIGR00304 family)